MNIVFIHNCYPIILFQPFHHIPSYSILFRPSVCSVLSFFLFYSICFFSFHFVSYRFIPLYSILLCSIPLYSIPIWSILFHFIQITSIYFCFIGMLNVDIP